MADVKAKKQKSASRKASSSRKSKAARRKSLLGALNPFNFFSKKRGKKRKSTKKTTNKSRFKTFLWRFFIYGTQIGVVLFAIPVIFTLLYALPFVQPVSTLMISDVVSFRGYDRRWADIEDVSPRVVHSILMSEDGKFCAHGGVDWGAIKIVVSDALSGERPRGASTITMQLVKNLYLWNGRSYLRKVLEVPLAVMVDAILSKKRILEIYLNIVELGPNIYGVEAAAQRRFGRSAQRLSGRQSALLAVTLPNPRQRNPARPTQAMVRVSHIVEARAKRAGAYVKCVK